MILELGIYHWGLEFYKVNINNDSWVNLTYSRGVKFGLTCLLCLFQMSGERLQDHWSSCFLFFGVFPTF